MDVSTLYQILGSVCVLIGYWLNSNSHPRQHMAFIAGHVFLIGFTFTEEKWILLMLSVFIIIMQYRISRRKYKFKKDIVRVKKTVRKIKNINNENERVSQEKPETRRNRHKKGHVLQGGKEQAGKPLVQRRVPAGQTEPRT